MKNRHMSSLPANAKSQRAALPSLFRALARESDLFWGSGKTTIPWVLEPTGGAPCPPHPSSGSGAVHGVRGAGRGREGVGCVRVPGCLCAWILARGR